VWLLGIEGNQLLNIYASFNSASDPLIVRETSYI
jgi:hypothetical protein